MHVTREQQTAGGPSGRWRACLQCPREAAFARPALPARPPVAGPSCAGPTHAGPSCAEPTHVGPSCAEPTHVEPTHAEPTHAAPTHAVPTHVEALAS